MNDGQPKLIADSSHRLVWVGLLLVCGLIFLPGLSSTDLWDEDEGFYVSTAQEMFDRGDWIVPYFNGRLFGHKPPWMYWMMMLSFQVMGVSELAARLPSALFSIGSVLLTVRIGSLMFRQSIGWLAGFILATSLFFTVSGRSATADPFLVFFTTAAMLMFVRIRWRDSLADPASPQRPGVSFQDTIWDRRLWTVGIYSLLGLGMLVKGPIAVLFPLTILGAFTFLSQLISKRDSRRSQRDCGNLPGIVSFVAVSLSRSLGQLHLITGIIVLLLVAAPWFLIVGWRTDGEFLREFFGVHHFQRATSSMEGHRGSPLFYYPVSIMIGMFPWTVFTVPSLIVCWQGLRRSATDQPGLLFLIIWVLVYMVVFSVAATKLPNYILPIYPAVAILFSYTIDCWLRKTPRYHAFWHRASLCTLIFSGLLMMTLVPLLQLTSYDGIPMLDRIGMSHSLQSEIFWLGGLGIPILVGACVTWILVERNWNRSALISFIGMGTLFLMLFWNVAAPWADQFQSSQQLTLHLHRAPPIDSTSSTSSNLKDRRSLAAYYYFRPSMVFYQRQPITRCWDSAQVSEFWRTYPDGAMIVETSRISEVEAATASPLRVILRVSRFPEKGELLLLEQEK